MSSSQMLWPSALIDLRGFHKGFQWRKLRAGHGLRAGPRRPRATKSAMIVAQDRPRSYFNPLPRGYFFHAQNNAASACIAAILGTTAAPAAVSLIATSTV